MADLNDILQYPEKMIQFVIDQWNSPPTCYLDKSGVVDFCTKNHSRFIAQASAVALVIGAIVLLWLAYRLLRALLRGLNHGLRRRRCQHNCGYRTLRRSDGQFDGCIRKKRCCVRCNRDHYLATAPDQLCPDGSHYMEKDFENGYIVYQCNTHNKVTMDDSVYEDMCSRLGQPRHGLIVLDHMLGRTYREKRRAKAPADSM